MSWLNPLIVHKEKPESIHPWSHSINETYLLSYKHAHNSIKNPVYPKIKEKVRYSYTVRFTVIGNMMTKEFIYCSRLVKGLYSYKWKTFDAPIIRGVIPIDWPGVLRELMFTYGYNKIQTSKNCVVLLNNTIVGGMDDLKNLIEERYIYHLALNYQKETIFQFVNYVKASGRACAYMHISIDNQPIGSLIFMLYNDICPITCNNFLRLCKSKKGGYPGTPVHRIVKDGWIQCGGYGLKEVPMSCENFIVNHDQRGIIGMTNAGRHIECSTQFFVLLQPQPWMKHRYVAFGKLIEGEETLKKIEEIQTFNESPLSNIIIYRSGVLNLDCTDITIQKHACEYIDAHIDDLVEIGDFFIEMLLEKVFLDLEVKVVKSILLPEANHKLEVEEEEEETEEDEEDTIMRERSSLHDSVRFFSKKKSHVSFVLDHDEKEEEEEEKIDDETFEISTDEDIMEKMTVNIPSEPEIKKGKPFYIPLTDVPYPGEKDSAYDLKKLLRGDYCLESDLDPKICETKEKKRTELLERTSEILKSYSHIQTVTEEVVFLTDSQEDIVQEYLSQYQEIASFGAGTVRKIANQYLVDNPLEIKKERVYTDEDLRKLRLAKSDVLSREQSRLVKLTEAPWEVHMEIKRRQTGFARAVDLVKMRLAEEEEDGENEQVSNESEGQEFLSARTSSIRFKVTDEQKAGTKRKPSIIPPNILKSLEIINQNQEADDESDESVSLSSVVPSGIAFHPSRTIIDDEDTHQSPSHIKKMRRPTAFVWHVPQDDEDDDDGDKTKIEEKNQDEKIAIVSNENDDNKADKITDGVQVSKTVDEPSVKVDVVDDKKSERKSARFHAKSDKTNEEEADNINGINDKENKGNTENVDVNDDTENEGNANKSNVKIIENKERRISYEEDEDKFDKVDAKNKSKAQLGSASTTSKRNSLLDRLYDEVAITETHPGGPTLKNYTPMSKLKKEILLLKSTRLSEVFEDNNVHHRTENKLEKSQSVEKFLAQYSNVAQKLSSEYIMALDKAERRSGKSLRSIEYKNQRPALSVTEYKNKYRTEKRDFEEETKSIKTVSRHFISDSSTSTISRLKDHDRRSY